MWQLETSWWEIIARGFFVYAVVFLLFRLMGKKQLGEMSPFDLVLLLIVSESVSPALTRDEKSLTGGAIAAATLLSISWLIDYLAFRSKKIEHWVEGTAQVVIDNGRLNQRLLNKEKITHDEIQEVLRTHHIDDIRDVRYGVLETNGKISIIKKDTKE